MKILLYFLLLLVGSFLLFTGNLFIKKYSIRLGKRLNIKKHYFELTLFLFISFSSQLSVSLISLFKISYEFAFAIIIGSNITSILFIIGFTAIFKPFNIRRSFIKFELAILALISSLFIIFMLNRKMPKFDSIIFIGIFILFYILNFLKKRRKESYEIEDYEKVKNPFFSIIIIIFCFCIIFLGAYLSVWSVKLIFNEAGIPLLIFGFIIIPFLIFLPQFFIFYDIIKRKKDNSIFIEELLKGNILSILLISSLIILFAKVQIASDLFIMLNIFMLAIYLIFTIFLIPKLSITRIKGLVMIIIYFIFIIINLTKIF